MLLIGGYLPLFFSFLPIVLSSWLPTSSKDQTALTTMGKSLNSYSSSGRIVVIGSVNTDLIIPVPRLPEEGETLVASPKLQIESKISPLDKMEGEKEKETENEDQDFTENLYYIPLPGGKGKKRDPN